MNRSFSFVLGSVLVALLGCGDDTSSGNGGGGGTGPGAGGGGTTSGGTTAATTSGGNTGGGGADGVGGDPTGSGGGGSDGSGGEGVGGEGGAAAAPCVDECADDAGCDEVPAAPGEVCQTCIEGEIAQTFNSDCTIAGASGSCCTSDASCGAFVNCLIGGGTPESCAGQNPAGAAKAIACVAASCGECGDGSIGGEGGGGGGDQGAPCADECANDQGCDLNPADPGDTCRLCVQDEVDLLLGSPCIQSAATSPCCQDDDDCADLVQCVVVDMQTVAECAQANEPGFARAEECILASCGDCGTPQ